MDIFLKEFIEIHPIKAIFIKIIMTKYYDRNGNYKAYSKDDKNLFSETDEHIGYFFNGFLYDTKGIAIGHVKGNYILDKSGQPIYHTK
jgi:hypothetical protein